MPRTDAEKRLHATYAAQVRWSKNDPVAGTAKARQTFADSFIDRVDPDRILPEAERLRRAESARKAHYTRLALLSVQARRKKAS